MNILEKLKITGHKSPGLRDFCMETIRFKKFLENARSLLDLFEDGNEKMLGEYILDRHYVTSLIDSVVERLGMMIYDACVLAPESGEELYAQYDIHKLKAGKLFGWHGTSEEDVKKNSDPDTSALFDPEYKLLLDVLKWLNGASSDYGSTVMDFMLQTFSCVISNPGSLDILKNDIVFKDMVAKGPGTDIYLVDLWEDAVAPPAKLRSIADINSIPLKFLLMDAYNGNSSPGTEDSKKAVTWVAAVSECQLSLNSLKSDFRFHLEATASGYEKSDYIFVFADNSIKTESIVPAEFHIEKTEYGRLAWRTDVASKAIEDSLILIGRNLFNENIRPV